MSRLAAVPLALGIVLGPALAAAGGGGARPPGGARYLKGVQQADGSWPDVDAEARGGTTSLATLALLAAGEPVESPAVTRAVRWLRAVEPVAPGANALPPRRPCS